MKQKLTCSLFVFLIAIQFLVNVYAQNDTGTPSLKTWANFPLFQSPQQFIQELTSDFFRGTSIWDLIAYTAGMVLYSFFVWKFYRFVSRREIIRITSYNVCYTNLLRLVIGKTVLWQRNICFGII